MTEPAQPLSGTRVLVVEDEALIAEEIRDRLSSRGMKVVGIADNAADAVALASGERPDLALMDIRLKGKADGVDAAVRIYRDFGVPAVFLTAHSDEATLKRALLAGQFGYVLKPFRELDLLVAIRMALARHRIDLTLRESQSTFRSEVRRLNSDLEAHIAERTAALRRANSELEAFIYSVSHDLRAPLRTVGGMSRMLREAIASQPAPRASELLDGIDESMRHMATRIEALLEFSRLGSQPLHRALTDVQALANEVIAEAGAEIVRHEVVVGELPAVFADPMHRNRLRARRRRRSLLRARQRRRDADALRGKSLRGLRAPAHGHSFPGRRRRARDREADH